MARQVVCATKIVIGRRLGCGCTGDYAFLDIRGPKCYRSSHDLQGRVQFPIGGTAREPQGMTLV
jgi:hypothetical protein